MQFMFALIDCNNFFVSCERVFNPRLRNKPVIIVSNYEGCVIARSNEAKKLGVKMSQPLFQIKDLIRKYNIQVYSSNLALYGDLSRRVMSLIKDLFSDVMIYSIDEAFVDLTGILGNKNVYQQCSELSHYIKKCTGIPVSIGVGSTKTLAKVANHIAKNSTNDGFFYLDTEQKIKQTLDTFPIRDIWGVGAQLEKKFHSLGAYFAGEILQLPASKIKTSFNLSVERTVRELAGISCIDLDQHNHVRKQIMVSRSFNHKVVELRDLQEALATYASMACEKLRKQGSVAGGMYISLETGAHNLKDNNYHNSLHIKLPIPSSDTCCIINAAKLGLEKIFRKGFEYKKVGIMLSDFCSNTNTQLDLFSSGTEKSDQLMKVIDEVNGKLGRNTIQVGAAGLDKKWKMQEVGKSPNYTSGWGELLRVKC